MEKKQFVKLAFAALTAASIAPVAAQANEVEGQIFLASAACGASSQAYDPYGAQNAARGYDSGYSSSSNWNQGYNAQPGSRYQSGYGSSSNWNQTQNPNASNWNQNQNYPSSSSSGTWNQTQNPGSSSGYQGQGYGSSSNYQGYGYPSTSTDYTNSNR